MKILGNPRWMAAALFTFCIVPVFYAVILRQEIFPWSSFPMYSGLNSGKNLILLSAYVVNDSGTEIPIEKTGILRPKYEYRWRIPVEELQHRAPEVEDLEKLKTFAGIFHDDLQRQNLKFKKLRFYFERWNSFTGPQRYHPDERRILYEQEF